MDILLLILGLLLLAVALVLFFKIAKKALSFIARIIINSVAGLVLIFLLRFVGIMVPLTLPVLVVVALFGVVGLAVILILMFFGVM